MLGSGAINAEKGVSFTIGDFLEAGRERLCLKVVVGGEGLARTVEEPIVNRPGLALTGFFKSFAWRRLQLVGNAESAYLSSLPGGEAAERFAALLAHKAGFFVFTGRHMPDAKMVELAAKHGAVILATPLKTRVFARLATFEMERLSAPRTTLYGTMIEVCGLGILLEGAAGLGKSECALGLVKRGSALVADDLTPSETVTLPRRYILGFATNKGSATSHVALLARAMGIPAVTGLGDITSRVQAGDYVHSFIITGDTIDVVFTTNANKPIYDSGMCQLRAENEDDDGYDPYSDRRPEPEPLFERDPWS